VDARLPTQKNFRQTQNGSFIVKAQSQLRKKPAAKGIRGANRTELAIQEVNVETTLPD